MSIWQGVGGYYEVFGIRGWLAMASYRLLGRPAVLTAKSDEIKHPVRLRLRTSDVSLYHDILLHGAYDLDLSQLRPRTIVDVGANIGIASVYYANKYPGATIVAVEPEESNYAALLQNVAPYPNVIPVNAALWKVDGEVGLGPGPEDRVGFSKWGFQVTENERVHRVRCITMRSLMAEANIDAIDLLKVDVEGAEKEIFETCDWIDKVQTMVVETHDRLKPGCSAAVSSVTQDFQRWEKGEISCFVRTSLLAELQVSSSQ